MPRAKRTEYESSEAAQRRKEQQRAYHYRTKYGMTPDEYTDTIARGCEICGSDLNIHIDHDHSTGAVRGPLCQRCNQAIGLLDEDPYRLQAAIDYLNFHKEIN